MDPDDLFPNTTENGPVIGEDLSRLPIADLEERINHLKVEIVRVEKELEARRISISTAESVFRS